VRLLRAEGPSGTPYEFVARQEDDGLYRISRQGEQQAIQVLANPECGLPMTADYDLFLVAPPLEEYGNGGRDARPNTAVKYQPLPNDPHTMASFYNREDTTRGNITSRTLQLVDTLNGTLGRGEHREMFHHSDDAGSPVSSMGDNFPATFYLPRAMEHRNGNEVVRFDEVCVVPDQQSFSLLVECIKGNGTARSDRIPASTSGLPTRYKATGTIDESSSDLCPTPWRQHNAEASETRPPDGARWPGKL